MNLGSDHKVLIVLDHGPRFAASSNTKLPILLKDLSSSTPREAAVIDKSMWSVAVECAIDMHRVVADLFPNDGKLMRFCLSDCVGRFLTQHWGERLITQKELMDSLGSAGPAMFSEDSSILNGVRMAVDALSEKTKLYIDIIEKEERRINSGERGVRRPRVPIPLRKTIKKSGYVIPKPKNEGSIVIFTKLESEKELDELEADITEIIMGRNTILGNLTVKENSFVSIDRVNLFIMNIYQPNEESKVQPRPSREIAPFLFSRVICCVAEGEKLRGAVHAVTIELYDLVSTTVSGIPMKEESLPNQSVNYDVELLHSKKAHLHLENIGLLDSKSHLLSSMGAYDTVKLSWATPSPKSKWNLFPRASCAVRVSPAICNSRPSLCLTSFLISGRNVMLEVSRQGVVASMQPNVNNKLISHTLIAHGGRIYVHAIRIGIDPVLDCASLRKLSNVRLISGLRTADFKTLINDSMIRCDRNQDIKPAETIGIPCSQPLKHLRRITRFWPIRMEDTFIYNVNNGPFDTIFTLLRKRELTQSDMEACKQTICGIATMKERSEPLTDEKFKCIKIKNSNNRTEQMVVALPELALHFANYANHSEKHLELLQLLMSLTGLDKTVSVNSGDVDLSENPSQIISLPPIRVSPNETIRTHSRSNSPLPKRSKKPQYCWKNGETVNLYQWISEQHNRSSRTKWKEFEGRREAGEAPAKLYPHLDLSTAPKKGEVM